MHMLSLLFFLKKIKVQTQTRRDTNVQVSVPGRGGHRQAETVQLKKLSRELNNSTGP